MTVTLVIIFLCGVAVGACGTFVLVNIIEARRRPIANPYTGMATGSYTPPKPDYETTELGHDPDERTTEK